MFTTSARRLEKNQQAVAALDAARQALDQVRAAGPKAQDTQLILAARRTEECVAILEGQQDACAVVAKVDAALVNVESGHAFEALDALILLTDQDRPRPDSPWTNNTPIIENAIGETRYKIAVMCLEEGDGYQIWSKFAEAAARSYQELAEHSTTAADKDRNSKNLAICTRLIYGGKEVNHSLGFPARPTPDCVKIARKWTRPPPSGGTKSSGSSNPKTPAWSEPPEPNETTVGR